MITLGVTAMALKASDLNIKRWRYFCSFARWYPDLFLDRIRPEKGGITLTLDQRAMLRSILRFVEVYGVFPRGWGKTFIEVLAGILVCVFYPGIDLGLSAQTKENAASLLVEKYRVILKHWPILSAEFDDKKCRFSKTETLLVLKNGSTYSNLANAQSSKGQRRQRLAIEEAALVDNRLFSDVLLPIVEVSRVCVGSYAISDPEELNQQICFYTTAGFRGSEEYARSVQMVKDMVELRGSIVLGADWRLPCYYGRGSTKAQIIKKRRTMPSVAFAQNYGSEWVGAATGALVNINSLLASRVLEVPEMRAGSEDAEYYIGVDVARSESTSRNQSSAVVIRVRRNEETGLVRNLDLVNLIHISNTLAFSAQALEIKRLQRKYHASMVIVDGNGLGTGLVDELMEHAYDPDTGEDLGCWDTVNTDATPADPNEALPVLFDIRGQSAPQAIIVQFISAVESGMLRLLSKRTEGEYKTEDLESATGEVLAYIETDFLVGEIANLRLKSSGTTLQVEQVVRKINKDRYSALAYCIYYIMTHENNDSEGDGDYYSELMSYV